jgi:hypothetical protein
MMTAFSDEIATKNMELGDKTRQNPAKLTPRILLQRPQAALLTAFNASLRNAPILAEVA